MERWEKLYAGKRMQDYIHLHIDEKISLEDISKAAMYSKWYSFRIFKEVFNKTPFEYIRALRLTNAARNIKDNTDLSILSVAVDAGFDSHEGFTKAFNQYFGVNPGRYRQDLPRRYKYFVPSPINSKEHIEMSENQRIVTVTIVEKPACKLILSRGVKARNYFELCQEIGCDKTELLEEMAKSVLGYAYGTKTINHIYPSHSASNMGRVSYVNLPGTSGAAFALEVPIDYDLDIPEGFDLLDLPPFLYMCFQGEPYEDENWFGCAHEELARAIANYKPDLYGYEYAKDRAPHFMYGTSATTGCREMIPVIPLK